MNDGYLDISEGGNVASEFNGVITSEEDWGLYI